jgi:hypothetical protein
MAEKYILNFEANTSKAVKSVDKLDDSIKETTKDTQDLDNSLGGLDQASGGLITKFKGLKQGLKNVITGFKSMRVAIIATGIGALVLAVSALGAAFTNTEEGQNKFNKIMLVISSVTGNLVDILASLGDAIIDAFTNPLDAIEKFKDFIVENITNRFEAAIDTIGFLGSAIKKVFSGDFAGAMDDAKSAGSSYIDTLTGIKGTIDKTTESVKGLADEIIREGKIAADIADQRAKADKLERQLIVDRAEADRQRAELLEQAVDREQFTVEQRIGFLEEAGKLEEDITNKEIQAAKIRLEAKQAENALAGSTKEDLEEEARLKAQVIQLETARLTKQKEVTSQIIALSAEEKAAATALADFKKTLQDAEAVTEEDKRALELEKLREHYAALREEAILNNLAVDELDAARDAAIEEKQATFDEADKLKRDKKIADEIAAAEKIAAEKKAIQDKAFADAVAIAGAESKLGKAILIAKQILLAKEMLMEMKATLFSAKQSATKTVMKSAEAGVDISSGAAKTASAVAFPANIPLILGYAAQAVGIIKTIKSAMKASKEATSKLGVSGSTVNIPDVSTTAGSTTTAQTPSFDILGTSGTNQLAAALGQQAPVQAFVVSQDVTSAQSLQNNIIQGASLG